MDGRSWSPKDAVRRDDQFTQAPDFYDEHDSDHLPMWGRLAATWHGMGPARQVMVAASLLVIAGAGAAIVLAWSATPGPSPSEGPLGASEGGPPVPSPAIPSPTVEVPGNLTSSSSGSPGPPRLPPPSFPALPSGDS
jgi:hypothetical protein